MKYEPILGKYLISLLRASLTGETPVLPPDNLSWSALYELAHKHSVTGIACYAILRLPEELRPQGVVLNKFVQTMQFTQARESMQHFEVSAFFDLLEENKIPYLPLKGWVLKHLYPRPDMRTMCDIDVLVDKKNMKPAADLLRQCGFVLKEKGSNHDGFLKPPHISLELHHSLFEEHTPLYSPFLDFLDRCHPAEGKENERKASQEDFFLYFIAHLEKHYNGGGTGARSIMDLWLYMKRYKHSMDMAYLEAEMDKMGILEFTRQLERLSQHWFSLANPVRESDEIGEYILSSGTYGHKAARMLFELVQYSKRGKLRYFISRCFPDRYFMMSQFPILKKVPLLFPFFWIIRGFRSISFNRKKFISEMNILRRIDADDIERTKKLQHQSGLQDKD